MLIFFNELIDLGSGFGCQEDLVKCRENTITLFGIHGKFRKLGRKW